MRAAGRWILLAFALTFTCDAAVCRADETRVRLQAPEDVQDLRLADVDGDGLADVVLVHGRRVQVHRGRSGRLPDAKPTWTRTLPESASFADVLPAAATGLPALLVFGSEGAHRLPIGGGGAATAIAGGDALTWHDDERVTLARLVRAGGVLLPHDDGWTYRPAGNGPAIRLAITRRHSVDAPGPFLEDVCAVKFLLPELVVGRAAWHAATPTDRALWTLDGPTTLIAQAPARRVRYDVGFLGTGGAGEDYDQFLVDLDGDGRPDLVHRIFTNLESRYGFFRTRPAGEDDTGPSHKPALNTLFLPGFQPDPAFVDLDGDGLKDLVITSIQVDAKNTLRALGAGAVTAETRAFLNRWRAGGTRFFGDEADAVVKSDVGVKIRFDYAGTIQIDRFHTILLDGDFDGDGRRDLAVRNTDTEMTIRSGTASGVWVAEGRTLAIPELGAHPNVDGHTADLDGDGRDEMVLHYARAQNNRAAVWVVDPQAAAK